MHIINLRKYYPHYTEDIFIEVSDKVYEVILPREVAIKLLAGRFYAQAYG